MLVCEVNEKHDWFSFVYPLISRRCFFFCCCFGIQEKKGKKNGTQERIRCCMCYRRWRNYMTIASRMVRCVFVLYVYFLWNNTIICYSYHLFLSTFLLVVGGFFLSLSSFPLWYRFRLCAQCSHICRFFSFTVLRRRRRRRLYFLVSLCLHFSWGASFFVFYSLAYHYVCTLKIKWV